MLHASFHFHSRKAGGTSIRNWLQLRFKDANITTLEGLSIQNEQVELCANANFACITSLRNPLDRAISSYLYEGRFMGAQNTPDGPPWPSLETIPNFLPFDTWMENKSKHCTQQKKQVGNPARVGTPRTPCLIYYQV